MKKWMLLLLLIVVCASCTERSTNLDVKHLAQLETLPLIDSVYVNYYNFNGEWVIRLTGSEKGFEIIVFREGKNFHEVMAEATDAYLGIIEQCEEKREDLK